MENLLEKNVCVYRKATTTERLICSISKNSIAFCIAILVAIFIALGIVTFSAIVFIPSSCSSLGGIMYSIIVCSTIWAFYEIFEKKIIYSVLEALPLFIYYTIMFGIFYSVMLFNFVVYFDSMMYYTILYLILLFATIVVIPTLLVHISKVNNS